MRGYLRFISVALTTLFFIFIGVILASYIYFAPGPHTDDTLVFIPRGSSLAVISDKILYKDHRVVSSKAAVVFPLVVRLKNKAGGLKAGEYMIPAKATPQQIMRILEDGKAYQRQITFAEGLTSFEIIERLNTCAADTLPDAERCALIGGVGESSGDEGKYLPESYAYDRDATRQSILDRMARDMTRLLDTAWENRVEGLPLKTKEEALILASIVEKETGVKAERTKVAGVFINRMRIGMPLQSDPTVIYAVTMGKGALGRPIYKKDLAKDSPYNTYKVNGLPPTPIANPGRASIEAVLNPATHDYLYFVADGTGGHVFAKTLAEHNANVAKWRKIEAGRK